MDTLLLAERGMKIYVSSLRRKLYGFHRYQGNAEQICRSIIENCWDEKNGFFRTSNGHFNIFFMRDFGWCCKSLLSLGQKERVKKTLEFALSHYAKNKRVSVCLTSQGKGFDFPRYSVDTLPYLLHSINLLGDKPLLRHYEHFLNSEISKFFSLVVDERSGLVRSDTFFSSMRDHALRKSSCYDNCFVALLQKEIAQTSLSNPFRHFDYKKILLRHFWNGNYFYSDLQKKPVVTADANLYPFYFGIIRNKEMLSRALKAIKKEGLDHPFPLKYTAKRFHEENFFFMELFVRNYETHSIWTHMGPIYLSLLKTIEPKRFLSFLHRYRSLVENYGNYLEVFDRQGKPFQTPFYVSDESMLWAANLLDLQSQLS